ncbi:MAG: RNA polymerase factor sigma-54 [Gammaproteobacteria bacterium]|nr:RNA polymerase factor sigma-54 [Gammaproteobacteria bacterium]
MKQSLQLRIGQHLTMTPQLQQAIRLLQLSALELQQEMQQALESNPMLEITEDESGDDEDTPAEQAREAEPVVVAESREADVEINDSTIPDDLPVDSTWDDTFETFDTYGASSSGNGSDHEGREFETQSNTGQSLHDHLLWQVQMAPFSPTDLSIAMTIIDAIDLDGYLTTPIEDLLPEFASDPDIGREEIEAVLHRIQQFDPPGIGARDLRESMLLQLKQYPPATVWLAEVQRLVSDHFDLLAHRDYNLLMRRMKLSETDLQQVIALLQTVNPRPGGQITDQQTEYVVPDVYVRKRNDVWKVELNPDTTPKLRINSMYSGMAQRSRNSADSTYLKNQLQEARWLLKSLQSRNETLLKVATCIVERQRGFLEYGDEAMQPLVMSIIAQEVNMHESTISRVTTKKYMHTPRGIYELKYFFSSHVATEDGGECSSTAIRAMLKKLISVEEPNKPLSDSKLASLLSDQGIKVARRTVAKYREAMTIPPSNERKRLS